jgi:hypothetical protein
VKNKIEEVEHMRKEHEESEKQKQSHHTYANCKAY